MHRSSPLPHPGTHLAIMAGQPTNQRWLRSETSQLMDNCRRFYPYPWYDNGVRWNHRAENREQPGLSRAMADWIARKLAWCGWED
jgi:hypothetical protein